MVSNGDPLQIGRVKIRVPLVHGLKDSEAGIVSDDDLPWALPCGLPAGGTQESGATSWIPVVGDQVWVRFLDGELDKPLWEWGNQNIRQKQRSIHSYEEDGSASRRLVMSRYGNSVEIAPDKVTVTTKEGYQIRLESSESESGGQAILVTPKGQSLRLNDTSQTAVLQALDASVISAKKVIVNAPTSALVKTTRFTLMVGTSTVTLQDNSILIATATGANVIVDESGNISLTSASGSSLAIEKGKVQLGESSGTGVVIEPNKLSINAAQVVFNTAAFSIGTAMGYPVVLMTPQLLQFLAAHTHTNGNNGSPTGPPILQDTTFPLDSVSTRMRLT